jgi:uncharacterized protein (DUF983 family)
MMLELVCFRAHNGLSVGGGNMPLVDPITEGKKFFCPHCGALYSIAHVRVPKRDSNIARCVVCMRVLDEGDSAKGSIYKLIHRPEDA